MVKVVVNGFGTIGKRVADAVAKHPKLELAGIGMYTVKPESRLASSKGIRIFTPNETRAEFEKSGVKIAGNIQEMIDSCDVVVDAAPNKIGDQNKQNLYLPKRKNAIFQGGEKDKVADISFNSRSNFDKASGVPYIRVVSCNTTAYCRLIKPLQENYKIKHVSAVLIRRGADPNDTKGSTLNSVEWEAHSHHGEDVQTIIDVPMTSLAFKIPHTHAHINSMFVTFEGQAPSKEELIELYKKENRIAVLDNAESSAQIVEAARDLVLPRNDTYVVSLLANTIESRDNNVFLSFFVPQESIVVPENIDAIVAQAKVMGKEESVRTTDDILGIGKIKRSLEEMFS